jgi:hypothetical protein
VAIVLEKNPGLLREECMNSVIKVLTWHEITEIKILKQILTPAEKKIKWLKYTSPRVNTTLKTLNQH